MWLIVLLIVIGALLLVAELVLLPGFFVAGICALLADGAAVYFAFTRYGAIGGVITIVAVLAVSVAVMVISLRARTWQRFSLKHQVDGTAQELPQEQNIRLGDRGVALTRIAPMGKIEINGRTFEAKSVDRMIDPNAEIEVIGFENFSVIIEEVNIV